MVRYLNVICKQIQSRSFVVQQAIKNANLQSHFLVHQRPRHTLLFKYVCKDMPESYVSKRKISTTDEPYYKYKYKPDLELAINEQIQAEQQAAQDYLNMAVFFLHPSVSRPGTGGFFMKMYEEEIEHMKDVIQYQLFRGGKVVTPCLGQPPFNDKLTMLGAFKLALQMEKMVTELIMNIINAAERAKDYQLADYFTSQFLKEQIKSINDLAHHVTQLNRLDGAGEFSLYFYDLQLAKIHPYTFKKNAV